MAVTVEQVASRVDRNGDMVTYSVDLRALDGVVEVKTGTVSREINITYGASVAEAKAELEAKVFAGIDEFRASADKLRAALTQKAWLDSDVADYITAGNGA